MKVYRTNDEDMQTINSWKIKGFEIPSIHGDLCIDAQSVFDDEGNLIATIVATKTVELTLAINPNLSNPALKLAAIRKLHSMLYLLKNRGYSEVHAFIPPDKERAFGRRLTAFGWLKSWTNYCKKF